MLLEGFALSTMLKLIDIILSAGFGSKSLPLEFDDNMFTLKIYYIKVNLHYLQCPKTKNQVIGSLFVYAGC